SFLSCRILLWIRRVVWPLGLPAGRVLRRWSVRRHRPGGGAQHRLVGVEVRARAGDGAVGGAAELVVVDGDGGQRGAAGVGGGVGQGDRGAADQAGPVLECGGVDIPDAGPVTGLRHVPGLFVDADARHQFAVEEGAYDVGVARWDRQREFTGVQADLIVRFGQARAREVLELPLGAGVCFGDADLFALGDGSGAAVVAVGVERELAVGPLGTIQAAVRAE